MTWKALNHSLKCRPLERLWLAFCIGCANKAGEISCSLLMLGLCVLLIVLLGWAEIENAPSLTCKLCAYLVHCALAVAVAVAAWNDHVLKRLLALLLLLLWIGS